MTRINFDKFLRNYLLRILHRVKIPPPRDANLKKPCSSCCFIVKLLIFFRGGWHLSQVHLNNDEMISL